MHKKNIIQFFNEKIKKNLRTLMDINSGNEMGDPTENLHTLIYGDKKEENLNDLEPLDKYLQPKKEEKKNSHFSLRNTGDFQVNSTLKKKKKRKVIKLFFIF